MWRVMTAISAAVIAAAVIFGNLAPADAGSGGAGAGKSGGAGAGKSGGAGAGKNGGAGVHAPVVQHPAIGGALEHCPIQQCRDGGGSRVVSDPPVKVGRHGLAEKEPATATTMQGCPGKHPDCLENRHPVVSSFINNNNKNAEILPPDCWVWSHNYHRWIWACGLRYPSFN